MALVAVAKKYSKNAERLHEHILNYRIIPDDNPRMNLSLRDISGGLLLVPPFTFAVVSRKGNHPRFISTTPQEKGRQQFGYLQHLTAQAISMLNSGSLARRCWFKGQDTFTRRRSAT